jgi:hypothetical protein
MRPIKKAILGLIARCFFFQPNVQQSAAVNGLLEKIFTFLCNAWPIPVYNRVQKAASFILYKFPTPGKKKLKLKE